MRLRHKTKGIVQVIIVLFISYIIYIAISISLYGNISEIVKADAALVLGAGTWEDKPSPVFEERIKHGIWLYKNGYVDKLIFTGGKGKNNDCSDSSIAKDYAIKQSIPIEDIFIEEESTITQENILFAAQIIKDNGIGTVIIVSDPLHMKRAMLMAKDYQLKAYTSPTPTTKYVSLKNKTLFLAREVFFYIGYEVYRLF
ncbi:YdcF family protein [Fusibacter bizertensis]